MNATDVMAKTLCLVYEVHKPGRNRTMDLDAVEVEGDKSLMTMSKCIFPSGIMDPALYASRFTRNGQWEGPEFLVSARKREYNRLLRLQASGQLSVTSKSSVIKLPNINGSVRSKSTMVTMRREKVCAEYAAFVNLETAIHDYVKTICLPCPIRAMKPCPLGLVDRVDEMFGDFATTAKAIANEFGRVYPDIKSAAKARLGPHFDPDEYAEVDEMVRRFYVSWRWVSFEAPDRLKEINAEIWKKEKGRVRAVAERAVADITLGLREVFSSMVGGLVDVLGEDKQIRPSAKLDKIRGFLETLADRNIVEDQELDNLAQKTRALLDGVRPQQLSLGSDVRETVRAGLGEIRTGLEDLVEDCKTRRIGRW